MDLKEHFAQIPWLKLLRDKIAIPELYLVYMLLGLSFTMVVLGIWPALVVTVVGTLYPAYMSFKSIECLQPDDDKQWLTYWMIFSGYHFLDNFLSSIPFYFLLKLSVLLYMFWPQTRGALASYNLVILPFYNNYQSKIDEAFSTIGVATSEEDPKKTD